MHQTVFEPSRRRPLVCVIGEFPPPAGGMGRQAALLVRNLLREQVPVRMVRTNIPLTGPLKIFEGVRGVRALIRYVSFLPACAVNIALSDAVHIFSNSYLAFFLYTLPPVVLARALGKRTVVNYHGGAAEAFFAKFPFATVFLRWSETVTVPSAFLQDVFEKVDVRCLVIPNICDLDRFRFRLRRKAGPVFVVARHLEKIYNVPCAIRAFGAVRECFSGARLLIAGSGSELSSLKQVVEQMGLSGSVEFLGEIPAEKMPNVFDQADFFLNSSNVDNMPLAILEAFAAGLPVISTRAGGIPHLVRDGVNGVLVDLDGSGAMAKAILNLLAEPPRAWRIAVNARRFVRTLQWPRVREALLPLYGTNEVPR